MPWSRSSLRSVVGNGTRPCSRAPVGPRDGRALVGRVSRHLRGRCDQPRTVHPPARRHRRHPPRPPGSSEAPWVRAPALVATGAVLAVLTTMGAAGIADWVPPLQLSQLRELLTEVVTPSLMALAILLPLAALGALTLLRRPASGPLERWQHLVPVAWSLGPPLLLAGLSVARPYLVPRYVVASVPGLAILVAVGAMDLTRRLSALSPRRAAAGVTRARRIGRRGRTRPRPGPTAPSPRRRLDRGG